MRPFGLLRVLALACLLPATVAHAQSIVREDTVRVGLLTFDVRAAGPEDGELVILLHGFPETSLEWVAQLEALGAAGYHAVAPNQRGYSDGARPWLPQSYTIDRLVGDVLGLADALGADTFHVVGHDWGAVIAWAVAGIAPERVASLTSMSIPHPDEFAAQLADPSSCQYAASAYFDLFTSPLAEAALLLPFGIPLALLYGDLDNRDAYVAYFLRRPARLTGALNWYRANIRSRQVVGEPLGPTTVPTLFLYGEDEEQLCREGADATGNHVTGPYRYVVMPGVDHWVPERAPDEVNEELLAHLAAHPAP